MPQNAVGKQLGVFFICFLSWGLVYIWAPGPDRLRLHDLIRCDPRGSRYLILLVIFRLISVLILVISIEIVTALRRISIVTTIVRTMVMIIVVRRS